jgi:putative ABC transport system permease protein
MKYLPYVLKHLGKNRIRTISTVLGMAVCIFLVCVLQTMTEAMRLAFDAAAPDRLITRHRVSLVFNMPNAYGSKLSGIPGVKSVSASNWFGGYYQDPKNFFTNFAVESETYFPMHPEFSVPPDQYAAYLRDMRGCIIGRQTADAFGWTIGSVIPLTSFIPPYQIGRPFEFTVRGIYDVDEGRHPGVDKGMLFFHYRHLYEATGQRVGVGTYNVQIDDPAKSASIAKAIDAEFENSDVQTKTESEKAFLASFAALGGNLALLLNAIGLAVAFTILLVTANTMSMAVRERRTEIAVLKTLGFPSGLVMALILVEAVVIGLVAGILGVGLASWFLTILGSLPGAGALASFGITNLKVSPVVAALTFALAVVLSLVAGFAPAWGSYRARITDMLRAA